jgi:hypothetical protein
VIAHPTDAVIRIVNGRWMLRANDTFANAAAEKVLKVILGGA